jgi:hypothetical protein
MIMNRRPSSATQAQQATAILTLPSHANTTHQQDSHHPKKHRQTACLAKERPKLAGVYTIHHNKSEVKQEWTSQTQSLTIMWSQRSGQPSTNERSQAFSATSGLRPKCDLQAARTASNKRLESNECIATV